MHKIISKADGFKLENLNARVVRWNKWSFTAFHPRPPPRTLPKYIIDFFINNQNHKIDNYFRY